MPPQAWEVWRAQWYQEEGGPDKVRPVLVLGALPGGYLCAKITSQPKPASVPHVVLRAEDESFPPTGLDRTSYLVLSDRLTLGAADLLERLGLLDDFYRALAHDVMREKRA